jgi:hypothetical protein
MSLSVISKNKSFLLIHYLQSIKFFSLALQEGRHRAIYSPVGAFSFNDSVGLLSVGFLILANSVSKLIRLIQERKEPRKKEYCKVFLKKMKEQRKKEYYRIFFKKRKELSD